MRLASLSPAITEILYLLHLQDQIACTDQFSNFPEAAKALPHVKDHQAVQPEELYEYEVDLVITSTVIQEKLAAELRARNFSVTHFDPRTIHEIYEVIRSVGVLFEVEKQASDLILHMQQGFNDVKRKAGLLSRKPKVYIEEWPAFAASQASSGKHSPPFASGNWVPEVARFAGCQQYPIAAGELSAAVSLQQVQQFDPDFIAISWCGAGLHADKHLLTEREGWESLPAVQAERVIVIDDSLLNRPGPRLVEGAQRLYSYAFELLHS